MNKQYNECGLYGCGNKVHCKNLCRSCYNRYHRGNWIGLLFDVEVSDLRHQGQGKRGKGKNLAPVRTYRNAHLRVTRERGKASEHVCQMCHRQAEDWALTPDAMDLRQDSTVQKQGRWFSANVDEYVALCKKDHRALDYGMVR